jgi:hypothetical protein
MAIPSRTSSWWPVMTQAVGDIVPYGVTLDGSACVVDAVAVCSADQT